MSSAHEFIVDMIKYMRDNGVHNAQEVYFIVEAKLGYSRADIAVMDCLSRREQRAIKRAVDKRIKGMSLQRIIGYTDWAGVRIMENKHTLSPRPETEYLVELVAREPKGSVLDVCTGSGCIALALAKRGYDVTACDLSKRALRCAKSNAKLNGLDVKWVHSDMFAGIRGKYDMVVSNPPYVTTDECKSLDKDVLLNDPIMALDGGKDGLDYYRIIARDAAQYLTDNGVLYLELGISQHQSVAKLLENCYKDITIIKDLNGVDRYIRAVKK